MSRGTQVALLAALVSIAGWAAFTSVKSFRADRIVAGLEQRVAYFASNFHSLSVDLRSAQEYIATLRSEIVSKQRELQAKRRQRANLAEQKTQLEKSLGALNDELKTVDHHRAELIEQKTALDDTLKSLAADLRSMANERDTVRVEAAMASQRVARLELALKGTARTRDRLTKKVRDLETRLATLKPAQQELVARIQEYTESSTGDLEAMIALTGLDVDALLEDAGPVLLGQGGPFIGPDDLGTQADKFRGLGDGLESSVAALEINFTRWNGLQNILQRLPLAAPLDSYYVSSGFGKRIDPFTKRKAMHYGVDLAGALKSPIWSTAPGVVTHVGRDGPYGGSIEIDHGRGITTRYSHLHKIMVKKGEVVPFRHKIGLMGNTGRSTGAHVHYEVIFKGVPQDPAKFMKAGKYVFKT